MKLPGARALIGDGGLLRKLEARCHLTTTKVQVATALLLTWVPVVVLGVTTEWLLGARVGVIHDVAVHVRLLVATPLLLFLDRVFPSACTHVVDRLGRDEFVLAADRERFASLVARTRARCESLLPEAALAILAITLGTATLFVVPGDLTLRSDLTAADWWYALVSSPLFEFMLFRSLWRWLLWAMFLLGLWRIDLDLDATHPDRRCGIAFLRKPSLAYCALLLSAVSAVLSAGWSERFQLATLSSFIPFLLVFAAAAILIAFGPLLLFAWPLHDARLEADEALGALAVRSGRHFRARWMNSDPEDVLATPDVQSLAALASTYRENVKQVRLVLFEKMDLILVVLATLGPVVPTMLLRIPYEEWLQMASFLVSKGGIP